MNDHQKFKDLLNKVGLSREEFSELMGMKFTSMTNQLAPAKDLPKWAKSVLIFEQRLQQTKEKEGV